VLSGPHNETECHCEAGILHMGSLREGKQDWPLFLFRCWWWTRRAKVNKNGVISAHFTGVHGTGHLTATLTCFLFLFRCWWWRTRRGTSE
jgi:hypothetical protein